jgi:hypothetical protein
LLSEFFTYKTDKGRGQKWLLPFSSPQPPAIPHILTYCLVQDQVIVMLFRDMWIEMPSLLRGEGWERVADTRKTSVWNTLPFIPSPCMIYG